jgi:hypothetical protein
MSDGIHRFNDLIKQVSDLKYDCSAGNFETDRRALYDFAKLIVRECIQVAANKDSGYMHPANVAGYIAAGRSTAAQMIKEHFGVEE